MMRKYFKESFEAYFKWLKFKNLVKKLTADKMNDLTWEFLHEIIGVKDKWKIERLISPVKTIVLCDRYNKEEKVIEGLDFTIFWNVLQKFTNVSRDDFLSQDGNAYLYMYFYNCGSQACLALQWDVEDAKLRAEFEEIKRIAEQYLK